MATLCNRGWGDIVFKHLTDTRYDAKTWFQCGGTTPWEFEVQLYPGTYEVTVIEGRN